MSQVDPFVSNPLPFLFLTWDRDHSPPSPSGQGLFKLGDADFYCLNTQLLLLGPITTVPGQSVIGPLSQSTSSLVSWLPTNPYQSIFLVKAVEVI